MKKSGKVLRSPNQMGNKGIPPGVGSNFRKGKGGEVFSSPSTMGNKGMPMSSYPGSRKLDPRMD